MRFTLLVLSPPDAGPANAHALSFAETLLEAGHDLACVFFHDAGVLTALSDCEAPHAEDDTRAAWRALARDCDVSLFACVASAARHGVYGGNAADRTAPGFTIAGLGELADARRSSDRLLTFAD